MAQDVFEKFGPARFTTASGEKFTVPASLAGWTVEQRNVVRARPYVDGAPIDNTGAQPDGFEMGLAFWNGWKIAGVNATLYPGEHARFMAACRRPGGTWTVYVPGRGEKRVRVGRAMTQQAPGERDGETVQISLIEDNEDERVTAAAFSLPSASVQGPSVVRRLLIDGPRFGVGGNLFTSIAEWADKLEAAVRAPLDAADQVSTFATRTIETSARAGRRLSSALGAYAPLAPASALGVVVDLIQAQDAAARQRGSSVVRSRAFPRPLTIFELAAETGQDIGDLIKLNARLPSPFLIPAGVSVRLKAT